MASNPAGGIGVPFTIETDNAEVTIERLAARMLQLEKAVEGNTQATKEASAANKGLLGSFASVANIVTGVASAFHLASGFIESFTHQLEAATAFGSKFQNLSLQFNTSAESLQKLAAIGKPFGVSTEQIARSMSILERQMDKMGPAFRKYGIDQKAISGLDTATRFETIAKKIAEIKSPTEQAAASMALLKDRSGAFLKLIRDPEGVQGAIKDFNDFGLAVSNNAVGALDALGNKKELLTDIFTSMKNNFLGAVASSGALQEAFRIVIEVMGKLSKFIKDNEATIRDWTNFIVQVAFATLAGLASTIIPRVIDAFTGFKIILAGLQAEFEALGHVAVFVFNAIAHPTQIGDGFKVLKLSISDTMDTLRKKTADAMAQNAAFQEKGQAVVKFLDSLTDRVGKASDKTKDFSANLLKNVEAGGLTEAQLKKVREATEQTNKNLDDLLRTQEEQAIALQEQADGLSEVERAINKIGRDAEEQIRKLEEQTKNAFSEIGEDGIRRFFDIPPDELAKMRNAEANIRSLAREAQDLKREAENIRIGNIGADAAAASFKKFFGEITIGARQSQEDVSDLGQAFLELKNQIGQDLSATDFAKLTNASLDSMIDHLLLTQKTLIETGQAGSTAAKQIADALRNAQQAALDPTRVRNKTLSDVKDERDKLAFTKERNKVLIDQIKLLEKTGQITHDEAENALPKAKDAAIDFGKALSIAADAAEILGATSLAKLIGGLTSAAAAGQQAAAAIDAANKAAARGESGAGRAKLAALGQAALSGLNTAGNIAASNRQNLSGRNAALSGAAQGAAFGSQFGLVGGIVGAVAGGLIGFFSGSKFRKIAKDAGKILGEGLSKETIAKIQEDSKKLNISIKAASLLNITTAMDEGKKSASEFGGAVKDLVKGIADGSVPAKEGLDQLGQSFARIADEALKAGRTGDRALVGIIKQARASGVESPEIKAFVSDQLDSAAAGFKKFTDLFKVKTQEEIDKLAEGGTKAFQGLSQSAVEKLAKDSGVIFGGIFNALVSEEGIVGAVDKMKDSFNDLRENLSKTLGEDAVNQILGPFGAAFDTIGNEQLRPLFEGIDGLSQAMKGLANAGFLTQDQFNALGHATKTLFDEAVAGGADMRTSLLAVSPAIQSAITASEQFGIPLDEDTQKLKDLAEQNGITFKTDPQQAMLDVLVSIAEVLGADIPESARKARESLEGLKQAAPDEIKVGGGAAGGGVAGPRAVQANVQVNLGINENPLAAADTAAQMRAQTVQWTAEAIQDRVPAIVAALENAA